MTLAILGSLAGLMVYSFFTAVLIKYKIDIILAIIIAYVEYERRELDVAAADEWRELILKSNRTFWTPICV